MGRMLRHTVTLALLCTLCTVSAVAQRTGPTKATSAEINVRVTYDNDRPAGNQIRVDLTNETGIPIATAFTDTDGRASFRVTALGVYRAKVTGMDIEDAVSEGVVIDYPNATRMVFVRAKRKASASEGSGSSVQSTGRAGSEQVTSAAQLKVPNTARKAFEKGLSEWQRQNYQKAAEEFEKAVAAYPAYDTAYNNLGVMYAHLKQPEKAMAAFERSVQLNDKNADADRNLARMVMRQKDFARAEDLLKKSLTVQPLDPGSLTMLSISEYENGKYEEALTDARKVHTLPHEGYSLSHFVAGQALERKQQYEAASTEYQVYLRESPNGPEVVQVKTALERLTASNSTQHADAQ